MPGNSRLHVNRELLVYKAFYFFFLSAFGSIFPYLPVYFRQIGLPASQVGLLIGVRPIVQLASAPFWAIVADKYRKRKAVLVMSTLAWLIMTLSLAFVEPTNVICELRAGNGTESRVVNYTKVKTGFFRRSLLSIQQGVDKDRVEKSPDLVVVSGEPRIGSPPHLLGEDEPPDSGQSSRGVLLSGSADHDFAHDEVSPLQYDPTGGRLVQVYSPKPGPLQEEESGNLASGDGPLNSAPRTFRKGMWGRFHRKNDSHVIREGKTGSRSKEASRHIIHLSSKQTINTDDHSKTNSTPTRYAFRSQANLDKEAVKRISQIVGDSGPDMTKAASQGSVVHGSGATEPGKRESLEEEGDTLTTDTDRQKSDEKYKKTRNDKSRQRPPIVIEFSRILIPQDENNTKSLLHRNPSGEQNAAGTPVEGDRNSGSLRQPTKEKPTFSLGFPYPPKKKETKELQSILQLRRPTLETASSHPITNKSSKQSQESVVFMESHGNSSRTGNESMASSDEEGEQGSGHDRASPWAIGNFTTEYDHSPNGIGQQSVFKDSLHEETLGDIVTKVIHHTNDVVLESEPSKLEWEDGTASGATLLEKTHSSEKKLVPGSTTDQSDTTTTEVDSDKTKNNWQLDGGQTKVENRTDPEFIADSEDSTTILKMSNAGSRNDGDETEAQIVTEPVPGKDRTGDVSNLAAALFTTKNLLKENVSELKRIFTILLVLIVVGEFLEAPSFTLADASLLEILGEERRYYGKQRLWGSLGFGIFSFLIGMLLERSKHSVCGDQYTDYIICFCVFAILMVCTLLVSTTFHFQYNGSKVEHSSVVHSLCNFHYGSCLIAACFMGVGHGMSHNFVNWFLEDLGGSKTLMGCAVICRCTADLLTFFIAGSLIKWIGQIRLMVVSLISYGVIFVSYSLLSNPWWVLPVEALNGITYAASWSACTSYMAGAVSPEAVTTVQGWSLIGNPFTPKSDQFQISPAA